MVMKCTWVLMSGGANNNLRGFIDEVVPEVLLSKETTIMNVVCVCVFGKVGEYLATLLYLKPCRL